MSFPVKAKKSGRLVIVSAPSGSGKTTIVNVLLKHNKRFTRSLSFTTRAPRRGERNGRDYYFVTKKEFLAKKKKGFFLESANVFGQFYGTSKPLVQKKLRAGKDVFLAIDVQGMKQLVKRFSKKIPMVSIFIMPPSIRVLRQRLKKRQTETNKELDKRLRAAKEEVKERWLYDYVITNKEVQIAVNEIERILCRQ